MDGNEFRKIMGNFMAGVTVVTMPSDPIQGITVNSFTSISLEPMLVSICLDNNSKAHKKITSNSQNVVDKRNGVGNGFCINILAETQQDIGEWFAGMGKDRESPFETEKIRFSPLGSVIFEDSIAYLDCSVYDEIELGDHTLHIGKVESGSIFQPNKSVLTYFRGKWGSGNV
jgi:flavin reductase (DIM6/NTAB) family NADH-FMN oxidoreductase RutF